MPHSTNPVQPRLPASVEGSPGKSLVSRSTEPAGAEFPTKSGGFGRVYLVGGGPGDPGLITVRGRECLEMADYVLYDGLANEQLLELAPQATCISVGKHGATPLWTQADISSRLVELAQAGQVVVRLKGGDPAVFARTAEELESLRAAGITFEVVPGITAALAAASYVGIPITHRQHASAVAFITGQQQSSGPQQHIDWPSLAKFPGTLVFYMGVTTVTEWTNQLLDAGKPLETPVAIVRRCTLADQQVVRCALGELIEHLTPSTKMRPPVIVIIGEVASLGEGFDWFTGKPLHGCGVLITRPSSELAGKSSSNRSAEAAHDWLTRELRELGADVYHQPSLEAVACEDSSDLDVALELLRLSSQLPAESQLRGVTFSSGNGVHALMRRLAERGMDVRVFAGIQLAAVGSATAASLQHYGLRADIVPADEDRFGARSLVKAISVAEAAKGHWLVTKNNRSRADLADGLREAGAAVTEAVCYETREVMGLRPAVRTALARGSIQFCAVTSSAGAVSARRLLAEHIQRVRPISFSPAVSQQLRSLDWPPISEADQCNPASLLAAILHAHQHSV